MNQLLRLPLLNYIQTEKNTYVKEKKINNNNNKRKNSTM